MHLGAIMAPLTPFLTDTGGRAWMGPVTCLRIGWYQPYEATPQIYDHVIWNAKHARSLAAVIAPPTPPRPHPFNLYPFLSSRTNTLKNVFPRPRFFAIRCVLRSWLGVSSIVDKRGEERRGVKGYFFSLQGYKCIPHRYYTSIARRNSYHNYLRPSCP